MLLAQGGGPPDLWAIFQLVVVAAVGVLVAAVAFFLKSLVAEFKTVTATLHEHTTDLALVKQDVKRHESEIVGQRQKTGELTTAVSRVSIAQQYALKKAGEG